MSEEQNNDNVTLADIQDEIKSMREEVQSEIESLKHTAKIHHERALTYSGVSVAAGVTCLGAGMLIATLASVPVYLFDGILFLVLGYGCLQYLLVRDKKLRGKLLKSN